MATSGLSVFPSAQALSFTAVRARPGDKVGDRSAGGLEVGTWWSRQEGDYEEETRGARRHHHPPDGAA